MNCVNPTVVWTEMGKRAWDNEEGRQMRETIPQRRFASRYMEYGVNQSWVEQGVVTIAPHTACPSLFI